jgi:hypothetical protein
MEKSLNKDILIEPLTERYDCSSFYCTNSELNEFLKSDALQDQEKTPEKIVVISMATASKSEKPIV